MNNLLKVTITSFVTVVLLSACQFRGAAEDVLPGVDVEISSDGAENESTNNTSSGSSDKDNNGAWDNGKHCPPGQKKKDKCKTDE